VFINQDLGDAVAAGKVSGPDGGHGKVEFEVLDGLAVIGNETIDDPSIHRVGTTSLVRV
jgi:hypothetical protein